MSSAPQSGVPSRRPDPASPGFQSRAAAQARDRGEPLLEALERRLPGAREHADATASYAFAVAVELGFDRGEAELVREAARLHHIGKLYVPKELTANASLSRGGASSVEFPAAERLAVGAGLAETLAFWLRAAGERFDGRGPDRLGGHLIPPEARIIRAACACDAALGRSDPGGPAARRRLEAVRALRTAAGTELDPQVVAALATVLARLG